MNLDMEIIEKILKQEENNYKFFSRLSAIYKEIEYRKPFEELAQEEMEHVDLLKAIIKNADFNFNRVEINNIKKHDFFYIKTIDENSDISSLFDFILKKCKISYDFFIILKERANCSFAKDVFSKLANLELALKYRFEEKKIDLIA